MSLSSPTPSLLQITLDPLGLYPGTCGQRSLHDDNPWGHKRAGDNWACTQLGLFLAIRFFGGKYSNPSYLVFGLNRRKASFTPMLQRNCTSFFDSFNSFIFPRKFLPYLGFVLMYIVWGMDPNFFSRKISSCPNILYNIHGIYIYIYIYTHTHS